MQSIMISPLLKGRLKMTKKKEVRYETNPFVENMIVPVGTKTLSYRRLEKRMMFS